MVRRMPEQWYEVAQAADGVLQGDFILDCPILDWHPAPLEAEGAGEEEQLKHNLDIVKIDAVVMTQACDLENNHVDDVVVCPLYTLDQVKIAWEAKQNATGQNPTAYSGRS